MHLLGVRRLRPRLLADARDRVGVEDAELVGGARVEDAARAAPPACAAPRGARRRGTCRAASSGSRARRPRARTVSTARRSIEPSSRPRRTSRNPSTSMASVRQSSIVWRTIGWSIGTSIGPPGSVSGQATTCGNASTSRSVGAHPQERRRHLLPAPRALEQQRALRVPAPARLEERRSRAPPGSARRAPRRGAGSRRPPRARSCAAGRARGRSPPRWPPPAARSRSRRRSACAARGPTPG